MTTIYLVRHGEYANPEYVFPGRLPGFPLTPNGRKQVEALTPYFRTKPIAALYSSPLLRTRETAEILGQAVDLPVRFDDRLLEVVTKAEGVPMSLFDKTNGELSYTPEYRQKGAESIGELADRVAGCIEETRQKYEGKEVLMVTHGDPMRYAVMKYRSMPMDFALSRSVGIPLAGGYVLQFEADSCVVTAIPTAAAD